MSNCKNTSETPVETLVQARIHLAIARARLAALVAKTATNPPQSR